MHTACARAPRRRSAPGRAALCSVCLVVACALALTSCRRYRTLEEIEEALEPLEDGEALASPDDPLEAGVVRLKRLFAQDGEAVLEREVAVEARADLTLTLEAGECYTFAAFAQGEADLDLELTEPNGLPVAADRSPDAFPVVAGYCAPETGTYAMRLSTPRGALDARAAAWRLPNDGRRLALEALETIRRQRFAEGRAMGPVQRAYVAERRTRRVPIATLPGRCYAAAAIGDSGLQDVDLAWLGADGRALLQDIGVDARPALAPLCPTEAGARHLEIAAREGEGVVYWQLFDWPSGEG